MKKWMAVCLAAVTAAALMTGCSGTKETKDTAAQTTASAAETKETGKTDTDTKAESKESSAQTDALESGADAGDGLDLEAAAGKHHVEIT